MRFRNILLISSLTLAVIGCSTPRQQAAIEPAPEDQEYVLRGFSLSIPVREGWNVVKQGPYKIVLSKQDSENHVHYAIQALVVELPEFNRDEEFLKYIESRMKKNRDKSASEVIKTETRFIAGQVDACVQSHSKEMKSPAAGKPADAKLSVLELVNFTCRYPDKKNAGIYLAFSKRSDASSADEDMEVQANKFFNRMNFRDL